MTTIDRQYLALIERIHDEGTIIDGRNGGTRTLSSQFPQIKWDLSNDAFPIIALRKQKFEHYLNEYLWEINGGDNIKDLNGVFVPNVDSRFIWDTWANEDGHIPYSYGACWRNNGELMAEHSVDQLRLLEDMLLEANPKEGPSKRNRRLVLITADPAKTALDHIGSFEQMNYPKQVPPCHPAITFTQVNGTLNAHVFSRSQDVVCGLPGDMIRYSLLTMCLARLVELKPAHVCFSFSDVHYYMEHEEKLLSVVNDYDGSKNNYPTMRIDGSYGKRLNEYTYQDFELSFYFPSKFKSFPLIA